MADIREYIELAQRFTTGISSADFASDQKTLLATLRCLEVISEASRHVDAVVKSRHPELPWSRIAGSGNVYRHDYPEIRPEIIWETVRTALPPLLAAVEAELREEGHKR